MHAREHGFNSPDPKPLDYIKIEQFHLLKNKAKASDAMLIGNVVLEPESIRQRLSSRAVILSSHSYHYQLNHKQESATKHVKHHFMASDK